MPAPTVPESTIVFVSDDELRRILETCSPAGGRGFRDRRDEALLRLMAGTGARLSEVAELRLADVVLAEGAPVVKDQWALENLAKAARHGEILFWSDRLPRDVQESLLTGFVTPVESLQAGLERAFDKHGPEARVIVMPHGPYVLPFVEAKQPTDSVV
jgi:integrase